MSSHRPHKSSYRPICPHTAPYVLIPPICPHTPHMSSHRHPMSSNTPFWNPVFFQVNLKPHTINNSHPHICPPGISTEGNNKRRKTCLGNSISSPRRGSGSWGETERFRSSNSLMCNLAKCRHLPSRRRLLLIPQKAKLAEVLTDFVHAVRPSGNRRSRRGGIGCRQGT